MHSPDLRILSITLATIGILLLQVPLLTSGLEWSEVLPDPDGTDDGKEYIELLGAEPLAGCTIRDAKSADTLELLQPGGGVILIIETESPLNTTENATIYGTGKAIGNGLGNTADNLSIECAGTVLLTMEYNTSSIEQYTPGMALHYADGMWAPGVPTPGVADDPSLPADPPPGSPADPQAGPPIAPTDPIIPSSGGRACNDTLAITLSAVRGTVGDVVHFTILSGNYASYEASAGGAVFAYGDTLAHAEHAITLPATGEVRITAKSEACGGEQRAVRIITVEPAERAIALMADTPPPVSDSYDSLPEQSSDAAQVTQDIASKHEVSPSLEIEEARQAPAATGAVVLDQDKDAVPWIAAFGIVTLIVSAWLFFHTTRTAINTPDGLPDDGHPSLSREHVGPARDVSTDLGGLQGEEEDIRASRKDDG